MSPTLKKLLNPRKEVGKLLQKMQEASSSPFWIEDEGGLLFGKPAPDRCLRVPVICGVQTAGWVYGNDMAPAIATMLSQMLEKEYEKKALGGEILNLYREINLIHNFSEQLSSSAGIAPIAQLALEKAGKVIQFKSGRVVFRPEPKAPLQVLAQTGETASKAFWDALTLNDRPGIHAGGQGEEYTLYAPLQIDQQSFGAVILLVTTPEERTAARLKLLNTIARQVASAIQIVRQDEQQRLHQLESNPSPDNFIQTLEDILEANLSDESFALPELCRRIGMSRSQLFRKMKALINESPSAFIRNFRLNRARKLLEKTDLMVSEIAYLVGYSDPAYFSYAFQEAFGTAPSAIRTGNTRLSGLSGN